MISFTPLLAILHIQIPVVLAFAFPPISYIRQIAPFKIPSENNEILERGRRYRSTHHSHSHTSHATERKDWHVWKTSDQLEENGLSISTPIPELLDNNMLDNSELIQKVVSILREWGAKWAGDNEWQGILNKSSLLHEVEESIVTLGFLVKFIDNMDDKEEPITIIDLCSGKGIFSLLASYVFRNRSGVGRIIMLDKADIKWNHVDRVNAYAEEDNRPFIDAWQCNLHEIDEIVNRLESIQSPKAIVGIHLCKTLSPAGIGVVNSLGKTQCPFFVLAPCCLPRAVLKRKLGKKSVIEVRRYETMEEREARKLAKKRRDDAMIRKSTKRPSTRGEQMTLSGDLYDDLACWKCGMPGHVKADCPSKQSTGKPQLIKPQMTEIDVSKVLISENPFDTYCRLLGTSIQRSNVDNVETGLVNNKVMHQKGNWNNGRKSIYIVAT